MGPRPGRTLRGDRGAGGEDPARHGAADHRPQHARGEERQRPQAGPHARRARRRLRDGRVAGWRSHRSGLGAQPARASGRGDRSGWVTTCGTSTAAWVDRRTRRSCTASTGSPRWPLGSTSTGWSRWPGRHLPGPRWTRCSGGGDPSEPSVAGGSVPSCDGDGWSGRARGCAPSAADRRRAGAGAGPRRGCGRPLPPLRRRAVTGRTRSTPGSASRVRAKRNCAASTSWRWRRRPASTASFPDGLERDARLRADALPAEVGQEDDDVAVDRLAAQNRHLSL